MSRKKAGEKVKQTFIEPCVRVWRNPLFMAHMALLTQCGISFSFIFYKIWMVTPENFLYKILDH